MVRDLQNLKSFGVSAVAALQFKNSERPTTGQRPKLYELEEVKRPKTSATGRLKSFANSEEGRGYGYGAGQMLGRSPLRW